MEAWWTIQQANNIGAIGGGAVGVVGAVVGSMSILVVRGRAKPLMVGLLVTMILVGLVSLGAGVAALVQKQPYHVWYPISLGGFLSTCIFGSLLPICLFGYRKAEVRRMEAEQLRRSQ
jgi:hypothetical protein